MKLLIKSFAFSEEKMKDVINLKDCTHKVFQKVYNNKICLNSNKIFSKKFQRVFINQNHFVQSQTIFPIDIVYRY